MYGLAHHGGHDRRMCAGMTDEWHMEGRLDTTGVLDEGAPEARLARYGRGSWAWCKGWARRQGSMGH